MNDQHEIEKITLLFVVVFVALVVIAVLVF